MSDSNRSELRIYDGLTSRQKFWAMVFSWLPFTSPTRARATQFVFNGRIWGHNGYVYFVKYRSSVLDLDASGELVSRPVTMQTVARFMYAEPHAWDSWGIPTDYKFFFEELTFRDTPSGRVPVFTNRIVELFSRSSPPESFEFIGVLSDKARDFLVAQFDVLYFYETLESRGFGILFQKG